MKKTIKKNIFGIIFLAIFIVALFALVLWNLCNNKNFFVANLTDISNIFILVCISYFLIEYRKDKLEKKKLLKSILEDIQQLVSKIEKEIVDNTFDFDLFLMDSRAIQNNCSILEEACRYFKIEKPVTYIKGEIEELHQYVSEKIDNDIKTFHNDVTITRHCKNIQYKTKDIISQLYF